MNKKIFSLLTAVFLFASNIFLPSTLFAHPGRTDSDGGHYCRTNCDSWGVPWNEWHPHRSYTPPPQSQEPDPIIVPPSDQPDDNIAPSPAPIKKKVKVVTGFHKKQCKNKKYHTRHCNVFKKNKKQSAKNKKFHAKKCSKTILK